MMKTNRLKSMAWIAALAAIAAGCTNNDAMDETPLTPSAQQMTLHVGVPGEDGPQTRVEYNDGAVGQSGKHTLTWQAEDKLTVVGFGSNNEYKGYSMNYIYGGTPGATSGDFTGSAITGAVTYNIYYPNTVTVNTTDGTATLDLTGQEQTTDNSTAHLKNYMLLTATGVATPTTDFKLNMESSIMKFVLSGIPAEVGKLKSLSWMVETKDGNAIQTLRFAEDAVAFSDAKTDLTAYLSFMPKDMTVKAGGKFSVLLTGEKMYLAEVTVTGGKTYAEAMRYTATITEGWKALDSMSFTVKVSSSTSLNFKIPFSTTDTTPADLIVDWGDGKATAVPTGTTLSSDNFNHTYASTGTYNITVISGQADVNQQQIPAIKFYNNNNDIANARKLASWDTPLLNTATTTFYQCFQYCSNLTSIPTELFYKNTAATNFVSCFAYCSSLTTIPAGLFDKNTETTYFGSCFDNCLLLASIPTGLFDKNTKATSFVNCFFNCGALTSVPTGLFDKNTEATNFSSCFEECKKLALNKYIFSSNDDKNRFLNKSMDFRGCFKNVGSQASSIGEAPELWSYERGNGTWSTSNCFSNTAISNAASVPSTGWGTPASITQ